MEIRDMVFKLNMGIKSILNDHQELQNFIDQLSSYVHSK